VQPNALSPEGTIIILNTSVFITGFHVGKGKPADIQTFLQDLISELGRLSPLSENYLFQSALLHCITSNRR
jgi:hypothetical protein